MTCPFVHTLHRKTISTLLQFTFHLLFIKSTFENSVSLKNNKNTRNCSYLVTKTLAFHVLFYKLIFFETLIIFLSPTIELITKVFCKSSHDSYQFNTGIGFSCFFRKRPMP